jgi:AraC-like DNA-binding protein
MNKEKGVVTSRPAGLPGFLFSHFTTAALILAEAGKVEVSPGACLVKSPGFPGYVMGTTGHLHGQWLYFAGRDAEVTLYGARIRLNTVFYPHATEFIPEALEEMRLEAAGQARQWREMVSILISRFFIRLGRSVPQSQADARTSRHLLEQRERFQGLRAEVLGDLRREWTTREMAKEVFLSPSRFQAVYRKFFGVSPIEDLLDARISHAQWLLTNTAMSVGKVAEECGFASSYYFSRVFKKRVGCAPSRYYELFVSAG